MPGNNTLRGHGLLMAQNALMALQDSQLHGNVNSRFSDSPPPYSSPEAHHSTVSQSPDQANEEQRLRKERLWQLTEERDASKPHYQLKAQLRQEEKLVDRADQDRTCPVPIGSSVRSVAYTNVKRRWVVQGIWDETWDHMASNSPMWKHEKPLKLESESDAEIPAHHSLFATPDPELPICEEEKREAKGKQAETRETKEREHQASRPFYQFNYQLSRERDRLLHGPSEHGIGNPDITAPDLNTRAYNNVKNDWIEWKIWDRLWGIIPGMSWKHEKSVMKHLRDEGFAVEEEDILQMNNDPVQPISFQKLRPSNDPEPDGNYFRLPRPSSRPVRQDSELKTWLRNRPWKPGIFSHSLPEVTENDSPTSSLAEPILQSFNRAPSPIVKQNVKSKRRKPTSSDSRDVLGPLHASKIMKPHAKRGRPRAQEPGNVQSSALEKKGQSHHQPSINGAKDQVTTERAEPLRRSPRNQKLQGTKRRESENEENVAQLSLEQPKRARGASTKSMNAARPQGISKDRKAPACRRKGK